MSAATPDHPDDANPPAGPGTAMSRNDRSSLQESLAEVLRSTAAASAAADAAEPGPVFESGRGPAAPAVHVGWSVGDPADDFPSDPADDADPIGEVAEPAELRPRLIPSSLRLGGSTPAPPPPAPAEPEVAEPAVRVEPEPEELVEPAPMIEALIIDPVVATVGSVTPWKPEDDDILPLRKRRRGRSPGPSTNTGLAGHTVLAGDTVPAGDSALVDQGHPVAVADRPARRFRRGR